MSAFAIDGVPCSAPAFENAALNPARHVVVEACAGSGKTWLLVQRILAALHAGTEPQEILAITFTKKAAGEMRERLQTELNAPQHRALRDLVWANGRSVQVRTFHSWFSQWVQGAPLAVLHQLGLPHDASLDESGLRLRPAAMQLFWELMGARADLKNAYERLVLRQGRHISKAVLDDLMARRVDCAMAGTGLPASLVAATHAMSGIWQQHANVNAALLSPRLRDVLDSAAAELAKGGKRPATQGALLAQALGSEAVFEKCSKALFTAEGKPRSLGEHADVLAAQDLLAEAKHWQVLQALIEHQQDATLLAAALNAAAAQAALQTRELDMPALEAAALQLMESEETAAWMALKLDARIRHVLIDEFQDTNPLQWRALKGWLESYAGAGAGRAPQLFVVGDPKQSIYRFRGATSSVFHAAKALVQELGGQVLTTDTTRRCSSAVVAAVNAVFEPLAQAGQYEGWRTHEAHEGGADAAGLYAPAMFKLPLAMRPAKARDAKRKTAPTEVDWRDTFTEAVQDPQESMREAEANQAAAALAQDIASGTPPQNWMVLSRTRSALVTMSAALRARGIAYAYAESVTLAERPEVQDLIAFLSALQDSADNLSLARALRSPVFSCVDADLTQLALAVRECQAQGGGVVTWWAVLLGTAWPRGCPLARAATRAAQANTLAQQLPPHDLLVAVLEGWQLRAAFAQSVPQDLRAAVVHGLDAMVEFVLQAQGQGFVGLADVLRQLRKAAPKCPPMASSDAVRLLTVHGAKGLQANSVLILDAWTGQKKSSTNQLVLRWGGHPGQATEALHLLSTADAKLVLPQVMQTEAELDAREELNGLYVGLTRAQRRVWVSAHEPHNPPKDAPPTWWELLEPYAQELPGLRTDAQTDAQTGANEPETGVFEWFDWALNLDEKTPKIAVDHARAAIESIAQNAASGHSALEREAMELGTFMHACLEALPTRAGGWQSQSALPWPSASELGCSAHQHLAATQLAQKLATGPQAWVWDASALDWWANEQELCHQGQWLRADRILRRKAGQGGAAWCIVDFKASAQAAQSLEATAQMARYADALAAAYGLPSSEVETLLLHP